MRGVVRARGKAALSAITAGDLVKATTLMQAALEATKEESPQFVIARTYYQLAQLHWHSSRHSEALEAAKKALDAVQRLRR